MEELEKDNDAELMIDEDGALQITEMFTPEWMGNRKRKRPFSIHVLRMVDIETVGDLNAVAEYIVERGRRVREALNSVNEIEDDAKLREQARRASKALNDFNPTPQLKEAMIRLIKSCCLPDLVNGIRVKVGSQTSMIKTINELLNVSNRADMGLINEICIAIIQANNPTGQEEKNSLSPVTGSSESRSAGVVNDATSSINDMSTVTVEPIRTSDR